MREGASFADGEPRRIQSHVITRLLFAPAFYRQMPGRVARSPSLFSKLKLCSENEKVSYNLLNSNEVSFVGGS